MKVDYYKDCGYIIDNIDCFKGEEQFLSQMENI